MNNPVTFQDFIAGLALTWHVYSVDGATEIETGDMTDQGNTNYVFDFPAAITDAGIYPVKVKDAAGVVGQGTVNWTGSAIAPAAGGSVYRSRYSF